MTIMIDNYLRAETMKFKDESGSIQNGDKWYFFDTAKFLDEELLHKKTIEGIKLNADEVALPSIADICYTGKGIMFEYNGQKYDITDSAHLKAALTSGATIRYFWNKKLYRKYGGTTTATIKALYIDTHGKYVPDVECTINKNIQ